MGQTFICNAPYLFSGIWSLCKGWLDENTQKRVQLHGSNYKEKLLEVIDEDQLISFLGGTRDVELDDDWGPWNDYEVVDGTKRDDVVGIRHKETGKLFTIQDYNRLPNYIIGEDFEVPEDAAEIEGIPE